MNTSHEPELFLMFNMQTLPPSGEVLYGRTFCWPALQFTP